MITISRPVVTSAQARHSGGFVGIHPPALGSFPDEHRERVVIPRQRLQDSERSAVLAGSLRPALTLLLRVPLLDLWVRAILRLRLAALQPSVLIAAEHRTADVAVITSDVDHEHVAALVTGLLAGLEITVCEVIAGSARLHRASAGGFWTCASATGTIFCAASKRPRLGAPE